MSISRGTHFCLFTARQKIYRYRARIVHLPLEEYNCERSNWKFVQLPFPWSIEFTFFLLFTGFGVLVAVFLAMILLLILFLSAFYRSGAFLTVTWFDNTVLLLCRHSCLLLKKNYPFIVDTVEKEFRRIAVTHFHETFNIKQAIVECDNASRILIEPAWSIRSLAFNVTLAKISTLVDIWEYSTSSSICNRSFSSKSRMIVTGRLKRKF